MSEDDKKELVISVLGLEKLFTPTMEYAGEQLKDLVKYLVERAINRLRREENSEYFHGLSARRIPLILDNNGDIPSLPVATAKSANPYDIFPNWDWPLHGNKSDKHLDNILCEVDRDIDREYFINKLYRSLSLNTTEKQRVIDAWPTLSQFQIDELIKVFIEEQDKFEREILGEHPSDIWSLVYKRQLEWAIIVLKDERIGLESFLIPPLNGDFLFPYFGLWPDFWLKNGVVLMDKVKDYRSASRALAQACSLSPDNSYAWLRLGYCYVRLKYFDFAMECFRKTRVLKPDHYELLLDMSELSILKNNLEESRVLLSDAKGKISSEYQHVFLTLDHLVQILEEGQWIEPPDELTCFIQDLNHETPWNWIDLKEFIDSSEALNDDDKRKASKMLQILIALSV